MKMLYLLPIFYVANSTGMLKPIVDRAKIEADKMGSTDPLQIAILEGNEEQIRANWPIHGRPQSRLFPKIAPYEFLQDGAISTHSLGLAVETVKPETVRLVLDLDADSKLINLIDDSNETPITRAARILKWANKHASRQNNITYFTNANTIANMLTACGANLRQKVPGTAKTRFNHLKSAQTLINKYGIVDEHC